MPLRTSIITIYDLNHVEPSLEVTVARLEDTLADMPLA